MRYIFLVIIVLLMITGCGQRAPKTGDKQVILVSILPQKTFVEKIAGNDFNVSVLVPHGANPTTYSLLPAQMAEITHATAWFKMGYVGFELSWGDKITQTNPDMKVVDLSLGLDLISASEGQLSGAASGVDPHTWLSPRLVKQMASSILKEVTELQPGKRSDYEENYRKFLIEIDQIDAKIKQILTGYEGRKFISFHPSLSYFARDYGLQQFSLYQRGKEPTPGHIAQLIDMARNENIGVIYIQSDFDKENARMLANEIKGNVIQVWPLNPDWGLNLIEMARLLKENFE